MDVLLSPSNISCNRVNALKFEGWSSLITARTLNATSAKPSMHLLISHFNHSPLIFVSEGKRITIGINFFKETIMKTTIPLNKFPFSSCPTKSPLWCCTDFCKYISLTIKTQSLDTVCFSEVIWQLSTNQLPQMLIFSRHSSRAVLVLSEEVYTFRSLYYNINANRIKILENLGRP